MFGNILVIVGTLLLVAAWIVQLSVGWWFPVALVVLGVLANTTGLLVIQHRSVARIHRIGR